MTENTTKSLAPGLLGHRSEFCRNAWFIRVPSGMSVEDLEAPATWRHATQLQEGDEIEALADDGSFDGLWRVITAGQGYAVLRRLRLWQREEQAAVDARANLEGVRYIPSKDWTAFNAEGLEVSSGHSYPDEARRALEAHKEEQKPAKKGKKVAQEDAAA